MYAVLSASRLMKAAEVREVCAELRNNPTLLMALELAAKEELYQHFTSDSKKKKQQAKRSLLRKTSPTLNIPCSDAKGKLMLADWSAGGGCTPSP